MALKTGFSALALGALLFSSTQALAQDFNGGVSVQWGNGEVNGQWNNGQQQWDNGQPQWNDGQAWTHQHTSDCHHGPMPRPPDHERGRYELQMVQRWVPGHYEQVWVPEQCRTGHWGRTRCRPGYTEQQWVPGRYEQAQQWVWVRAPRWDGHHRAAPVTYYP